MVYFMNNAIIVHGKPTEERYNNPLLPKPHKANWLPWIGARLEENGMDVSIPAMPKPFYPEYSAWKEVFDKQSINRETALIGHSAGAEFILRWLSENQSITIEKIALIAPYQDNAGKYGDFSQYILDTSITARVGKIIIFSSVDDSEAIQKNAQSLASKLPSSQLIELSGYGHFIIGNNMTNPEFPELYTELIK